MSAKPSFFAELKRRNVYKVGAMYAIAGWLLVQVATQVFPFFDVPNSAVRMVVILVAIGFPIALIISWIYDLTPEGLVWTDDLPVEESLPQASARRGMDRKLNYALGGLLAIALAYVVAERTVLKAVPASVSAPATAASVVTSKSIAVLPFTDLSPGKDQEYFSDGMAEELLNALAKVKDLKVAGRTSSFSFKGKNEDLRAIGKALGVTTILEGSVRKQGDKVRITAQLIQTEDGFHLWSETYDGDTKDVFELQERIARSITDALKVVLVGEQQQRLVPVATNNPEAYALYLQATTIFNRRDGAHFPDAISALHEAIRLDPKFARAHSRLAALHAVATNYMAIDFDDALATVEREAQIAIALDPGLAEPHAALGTAADARRRSLPSRKALEQALALDATDVTSNFWLAVNLMCTGYRHAGVAQLDRTLTLDPLLPNALVWRGTVYLDTGERERARRMLQQSVDAGLSYGEHRLAFLAHAEGHDAEAVAYSTRGMRAFLSGFPNDASPILAKGLFGDAAAHARALAMIDAYLAGHPKTLSGAAPWALLMLGEPARALAVAHDAPTNNDVLFFNYLWSPYGEAARKLPQFPEFARKVGWTKLWDHYGPPDRCQRKAQGDYVCE